MRGRAAFSTLDNVAYDNLPAKGGYPDGVMESTSLPRRAAGASTSSRSATPPTRRARRPLHGARLELAPLRGHRHHRGPCPTPCAPFSPSGPTSPDCVWAGHPSDGGTSCQRPLYLPLAPWEKTTPRQSGLSGGRRGGRDGCERLSGQATSSRSPARRSAPLMRCTSSAASAPPTESSKDSAYATGWWGRWRARSDNDPPDRRGRLLVCPKPRRRGRLAPPCHEPFRQTS